MPSFLAINIPSITTATTKKTIFKARRTLSEEERGALGIESDVRHARRRTRLMSAAVGANGKEEVRLSN